MSQPNPQLFHFLVEQLTESYKAEIDAVYADKKLSSEEKKARGAEVTARFKGDIEELKKKLLPRQNTAAGATAITFPAIPATEILKDDFPWPDSAPDASAFKIVPDERFTVMPEDYFVDRIYLERKVVARHWSSPYGESELINEQGERVDFRKSTRTAIWNPQKGKEKLTLSKEGHRVLIYLISDELKQYRLQKILSKI